MISCCVALPLAFFAFVRHELIGRRVASYPAFKKQKTLMGERTEDRKRRSVRLSARISMRQPLKKGAECSSLVARLKLLLRAFLPAIPPRGPFTELATTGRREASYLGWVGNPQLVHRWGSLLGGARLPVFMTRLAYRGLVVAILAGGWQCRTVRV